MKVLFATSEALPFAASGGLAEVAGSLPQALRRLHTASRVVLPLYESVPAALREQMRFVTSITVPVSWRRQYCGIFEAEAGGIQYYLLDNEYYFKRANLYGHFDDGERFAFFARAVLEMIPYIDFKPDILHCNDWQTALLPVYYSTQYAARPGYEGIKTVFTIHNMQYQGIYGREILGDVFGLSDAEYPLLTFDGNINLMKGGIECCDAVTTVSPSYANEILDPWYSHGLDPMLRLRAGKLRGILNGIDTTSYDPQADPLLAAPFSAKQTQGKAKNKAALQQQLSLPEQADTPILAMVTRLVSHKGLDLVRTVMRDLLAGQALQLVVLGSGDYEYEAFFRSLAAEFPQQCAFYGGFIPDLARKIYAGADLFLMPSKSEPCGLSQMIALRYGAIPIVRLTGGLADTVSDSGDGKGNGFTFQSYNAHDMQDAILRALACYRDKAAWQALTERAMTCDNSWNKSAGDYLRLYQELLEQGISVVEKV